MMIISPLVKLLLHSQCQEVKVQNGGGVINEEHCDAQMEPIMIFAKEELAGA